MKNKKKYLICSWLILIIAFFPLLGLAKQKEKQAPSWQKDDFALYLGVKKIDKQRDVLIKQLEKLLKKQTKSGLKAKLTYSLLHNYFQKYVSNHQIENDAYEIRYNRWKKTKKGRRPKRSTQKSKKIVSKIFKLSNTMETKYKKYKEIDEVLFLHATVLQMEGKNAQAIKYLKQLVSKYPKTKRRDHAYYLIGGYYFDIFNYKGAQQAYNKVVKGKSSKLKLPSLYKVAWCAYYRRDYRTALRTLKTVVSKSKSVSKQERVKAIQMRESALQDMIQVYIELGAINQGLAYFKNHADKEMLRDIYERFGTKLISYGKVKAGANLIKKRIAMDPYGEESPQLFSQIIAASDSKMNKSFLLAQLIGYAKRYGPKSNYIKKNRSKSQIVKKTLEQVEKVFSYHVKKIHQQAQKQKNMGLYKWSLKGYLSYLEYFPRSKGSYYNTFMASEITYKLAQKSKELKKKLVLYTQAMMLYSKVVGYGAKQKYFKPAIKTMLLSATRAFDPEWQKIRKRKYVFSGKKRPLSSVAKNFIKSCTKYQAVFPKGKVSKQCEMDKAEVLIKHRQYKRAETQLWSIIKRYPKGKESAYAGLLLLDLHKKRPSYINVLERLLKSQALKGSELHKAIAKSLRGEKLDLAKKYEKQGKYVAASKVYLDYQRKNPRVKEASAAMFNAALNLEKAGKVYESLKVYTSLIKKYPRAPMAYEVVNKVAVLNEAVFNFDAASKAIKKVALSSKNTQKKISLLFTGALLAELADSPRAVGQYSEIIRKYPRSSEAMEAAKNILEYYKRSKKLGAFLNFGTKIIKMSGMDNNLMIIIMGSMAHVYMERKNHSQKNRLFKRILRLSQNTNLTPESAYYVAEALYYRATPKINKVVKSPLLPAALQKSIEKKLALLEQVVASFNPTFDLKDASWTFAALIDISDLYKNVADQIQKAPMPPGVKEKDKAKIRQTFQKQLVIPLKQKAFSFLSKAKNILQTHRVDIPQVKKLHLELEEQSTRKIVSYDPTDVQGPRFSEATFYSHDSLDEIID